MRLLPTEVENKIFSNIYKSYVSDKYKFVMERNNLNTIGGKQEAFFGWVASNFLVYFGIFEGKKVQYSLKKTG